MKFVILGDFNTDFLNRPSQHLLDMLTLYQLKQLINIHTRTTETTSSCLDLIITQSPQIIKRADVLPTICSDHNVPCAFLQNNITKNVSFKRTIYNYNKLNSEKFCNLLSSIDWLNFTTGWTIDECTDLFTEIFTNIAKQCMPFKVVTVRSKDVPWLTSEIRKVI